MRVFVVGGRVVASAERRSDDWRTNVARGGEMRAIELPEGWAALALRAADAVGVDYGGVDLLPGASDDVFVTEVNGIPGWKGLEACTGVDVAGAVADHVVARAADDPAERFRRRIGELEDRLEAASGPVEREALRRDIEHLEAGLRVVTRRR